MKLKQFIHHLLHWEYWPMWAVYLPVMPIWMWYSIKSRSLFFFSLSNPSIRNGGMAMESKMEIYDLMPKAHFPNTIFISKDSDSDRLITQFEKSDIAFPCIVKPDIGMKAFAVAIAKDVPSLCNYKKKLGENFLIQEFIDYPEEIGIFYTRLPGSNTGKITGMVKKNFLCLYGDGLHTVRQLIQRTPRSNRQMTQLEKLHGTALDNVLMKDEKFVLVPFGSHTRGAMFEDITQELNEQLNKTIDDICRSIEGFYFGRLDIRYRNLNELSLGKNFSIIEINGAGSEPTHMYDPKHSIFFAWKEIARHWKILYEIAIENKTLGHKPITYRQGMQMLSENKELSAKLKHII
jgi:hypothetical protein